jgi:thiol-disulfide isomerase/thioredoxin
MSGESSSHAAATRGVASPQPEGESRPTAPTASVSPRRLFLGWLTIVGLLVAVSMAREPGRSEPSAEPFVPFSIPSFSISDLDGNAITSDWFDGRLTLVNFWATWCKLCRTEIPDLLELQRRYASRVQIIGIAVDSGGEEQVRDFMEALAIDYPVALSTPELEQMFGGIDRVPLTYLVGPDRLVMARFVGEIRLDEVTKVLSGYFQSGS